MSKIEMGWSDYIPWKADRDPESVPSQVRPGDIIKSDLMLRPQHLGKGYDLFIPGYEWTVETGESFQLVSPDETPRYVVYGSFRIWQAKTLEQIEEEALIVELLDAQLEL